MNANEIVNIQANQPAGRLSMHHNHVENEDSLKTKRI